MLPIAWIVACAAVGAIAQTAPPEEGRAYEVAVKMFQDGLFELADRECAAYTAAYPNSARMADVVVVQAQARLKLKRFDDALALLTDHAAAAGARADEFAFWRAEILSQKGQPGPAAYAFAQLATSFPQSPRRLNAAYREAYLRHELGETDRAVALLRDPNLPFTQAAAAQPESEFAARGRLLLAEILNSKSDFKGAQETLATIGERPLPPQLQWERSFLMARLKIGAGLIQEAYPLFTNLTAATPPSVPPERRTAAVLLQADVLERLGQTEPALQTYEQLLAQDTAGPQRRQTVDQYLDLSLRTPDLDTTAQRFETLLKARPDDPALDPIRLTLGELKLKQYYAAKVAAPSAPPGNLAPATDLLAQARAQFDWVVTNRPPGPLLGRAQLNRGWCCWEEGPQSLAESLNAFREAATHLPASPDQTLARFKWADCQLRLADTAGAISNYWLVATNTLPAAASTNHLTPQALAQIVRAGVQSGDLPAASTALNHLLRADPTGQLADRSTLLVGEAFARQGQPQSARTLYEEFVRRYTNSASLPEIQLALATTFEQEQGWQAAFAAYAAWLGAYTNNPAVSTNMIAQATFDLARVAYRAQPDTNALALLTNFVSRFPYHTNAPLAQYLVGEYAFGQGDYAAAELHFQDRSLVQNTNLLWGELTYRARLMAGRAAVARQSYRSARDHFDWLITNGPLHVANSPIPVSLAAEAYLFRGDTFLLEPTQGETNNLARFGEAINAFSRITERFPTNEFAPLAWGRIGECHFQLASLDPKRYENAINAFRRVLESPADASVRSQAEWKLGVVIEKKSQLRPLPERTALAEQALDHYLHVIYAKNLRPGEQPDLYWVKRAGLSAAELAENLKKWDVALGLNRRLMNDVPTLRPRLEKKIEELTAVQQKADTPP